MARTKMKNSPKKNEILKVARDLFLKNWFEGTSMQNIIDAANTSKWGIYHYFNSKDEILETVIVTELTPLFENTKKIFENDSLNPLQKVKKIITTRSDFLLSNFDLLEKMSKFREFVKVRFRAAQMVREFTQDVLSKIVEEWVNEGLFTISHSKEIIKLIVSTHSYIFNYGVDVIKTKHELKRFLEAIDIAFDILFTQNNNSTNNS